MKSSLTTTALFLSASLISAQSSVRKAGSFSEENNYISGTSSWVSTNNVLVEDDLVTSSTQGLSALSLIKSNYLVINNFDFDIPETAIIQGIEVTVKRKASSSNILFSIRDEKVELFMTDEPISENKASSIKWTSSLAFVSYGDTLDKWSSELSPAIVNDPQFGVALSVKFDGLLAPIGSSNMKANIDVVYVDVFFSTPLPVSLLAFDAERLTSTSVQLTWTTFSEENNDYFTLERSIDGVHWEVIAKKKGGGNSISKIHYNYVDHYNSFPLSYYRLKQTDYDGKLEYFKPIVVKNEISNVSRVCPSICSDFVTVESEEPIKRIQIFNSRGGIEKAFLPGNFSTSYTYRGSLDPGAYFVVIETYDGRLEKKKIIWAK